MPGAEFGLKECEADLVSYFLWEGPQVAPRGAAPFQGPARDRLFVIRLILAYTPGPGQNLAVLSNAHKSPEARQGGEGVTIARLAV